MKTDHPVVPAKSLLLVGAVLITMVLWGSAYAFIRVALTGFGPGELALLRFIIASILLAVMGAIGRMRLPDGRDLPAIFVLGAVGIAVYHCALNWGQVTVPAGTASLLIATSPVFTALLATAFLGDRPGVRGWGGIAISMLGVGLVVAGKQAGKFTVDYRAMFIVAASVAAACFTVMQKPYLRKYTAFQLTTYAAWAGTLWLMVFAPTMVKQWHASPWKIANAAIYLGLFPAALGNTTWTYTLSKLPASRAVSVLYLIPPVAALFGWLVMGEIPTAMTLAGGTIVVIGVALVNSRRPTSPGRARKYMTHRRDAEIAEKTAECVPRMETNEDE